MSGASPGRLERAVDLDGVRRRRRLPVRARRRRPGRPRRGGAGRRWPTCRRRLAAIELDDDVGGPAAARGLRRPAVRPGAPAPSSSCPRWSCGSDADGTPLGHHASTAPSADLAPAPRRRAVGAAAFTLRPGVDRRAPTWPRSRRAATRSRAGRLTKVVLARDVVGRGRPADRRPRRAAPPAGRRSARSHLFSVDGFVGASPELLVARHGDVVRAHPLAGTTPRTGDPDLDARLAAAAASPRTKDQVEHRVTIDMVHDTLLPWCSYLDWEAEPSIVTVANVQHLGTASRAGCRRRRRRCSSWWPALQPTPALGGYPRADALAAHRRARGPFDRGRYGGAGRLGRRRAATATWAVGIRCAEIDGPHGPAVRRGRGRGRSDPDAELAETQAKFQAMLSAIVRP